MRFAGLVLALLGALPPLSSAEIVVLSTGERMDVASFEVQEHVVVVKTWDGRLRALPRAYVDVEATERANLAPGSNIPEERLEKARQVCRDSGLHSTVAGYHEILDKQLMKMRGHMTIAQYDRIRASFRNAFSGERTFDVVVAHVAENADDALLDAWSSWLQTPLARRMVAMESDELDDGEANDARRYRTKLRADKRAHDRRLELAEALDRARHATTAGIEAALFMLEAFYRAGQDIFPEEEIEFDADELRRELTRSLRNTNRDSYVLLFRDATDDELERYIAYWQSHDGQRIVELINQATQAGAQYSSDVAIQILEGVRTTVP